MIAFMLAAASVSCSVGQLLTGDGGARSGGSRTQTPRPTFTPARGVLLTMLPGPGQGVLGVLPPGVTAVAPDAQSGQPTGSTSVILFATPTPGPQPIQSPTKTSKPTITPTSPPTPSPSSTPYVVVSSATVNGRRGPGTSYELIGQAKQGQALMLMGRSAASDWWLVCCISNQAAWVNAEGVTPKGTSEGAPLLTPGPTLAPTLRPPPSATPTVTPTPQPPFDIAQGPLYPIQRDTGVMTIWVKVYEGPLDNQKPLAGYVLKVFRDSVDVSQPLQSYAHTDFDHTSWSEPTNDLTYNLKFELNKAGEAKWKIYLARPAGDRVSPVTEFTTLGDAYRNLVVYVAYWLAR
jgi:SH3-like domain-containing protein